MAHSYRLEIITVVAIGLFIIFLSLNPASHGSAFAGTDDIAAAEISGSSGNSTGAVHPLVPQWVPPSAEIESTLFSLQAAIGGIVIGGVFGYWIGQKKKG